MVILSALYLDNSSCNLVSISRLRMYSSVHPFSVIMAAISLKLAPVVEVLKLAESVLMRCNCMALLDLDLFLRLAQLKYLVK